MPCLLDPAVSRLGIVLTDMNYYCVPRLNNITMYTDINSRTTQAQRRLPSSPLQILPFAHSPMPLMATPRPKLAALPPARVFAAQQHFRRPNATG